MADYEQQVERMLEVMDNGLPRYYEGFTIHSGPGRQVPGEIPDYVPFREHEVQIRILQSTENEARKNPTHEIRMHLNATENYRDDDDDDGLLFVPGLPQQVKDPDDLPLFYREKGDGQVEIGFKSSKAALQVSGLDHMDVTSGHRLCVPCLDALDYFSKFVANTGPHSRALTDRSVLHNAVILHHSLNSLQSYALAYDCHVCKPVLDNINRGIPRALMVRHASRLRIEMAWSSLLNHEKKTKLYLALVDPSLPKRQVWNWTVVLELDVWPKSQYGKFFKPFIPPAKKVGEPVSGRQDTQQLHSIPPKSRKGFRKLLTRLGSSKQSTGTAGPSAPTLDVSETEKKPALARTWLTRCESNDSGKHSQCIKQDSDYLPTRLLDVEHAARTGMLRLVCPQERPRMFQSRRTFITLSHCWGAWGSQNNPILTTSNLQTRVSNRMRVADLPQTFQDAVEATRWFGVQWLWIDCFCILQDSASDWAKEARLMDRTYRHALLNLSNDTGHDSRSSFFPDLTNLDETSTTPLALEINSHGFHQTFHLTLMPDVYFLPTLNAPSFSRAWIHRERQIARRILHFTSKEMVWECCGHNGGSFASETFPHGAPFSRLFQGTAAAKFQIGRLQQGLEEGAEETYAVWNDVCEQLSAKKLTKKRDLPIVLSSLAEEFQGFLPGEEYVCGFWRSMLPFGLLWKTRSLKEETEERDLPVAPSWSWLSAGCGVTLASRGKLHSETYQVDYVAEIKDIQIKGTEGYPFGPVETGVLELQTVVRKVLLEFEEGSRSAMLSVLDEWDAEDGEAKRSLWRRLGPTWTPEQGDRGKVELDGGLDSYALECYFAFVTFEWWNPSNVNGNREIQGSLLKKSVGAEESNSGMAFERIGTLKLDDLYALMMRYRVDDLQAKAVAETQVSLTEPVYVEDTDSKDWKRIQGWLSFMNDSIWKEERKTALGGIRSDDSSDTSQASSGGAGEGARDADSRTRSVKYRSSSASASVADEAASQDGPNPAKDDGHEAGEHTDVSVNSAEAQNEETSSAASVLESLEDELRMTGDGSSLNGHDVLYQYDRTIYSVLKANQHITQLSQLETTAVVVI